ncbi:MAG TPA: NUDIX hydrolase [Micromonosporaceae bacterium]|nr:NUDIX hydrolase [Micromonosporaceae bacterium]HCU49899.1 NUDIX hydrolase [Micromonosporaceae bacterium]
MEPRQRFAVRVLLVNAEGAVLLFRGFDPVKPEERYWFTPGGGIDPQESAADAASRELQEETGLALPPSAFGEPVHSDTTHFSFDGVSYRQEQEFYLVRVGEWIVDTSGFDGYEADSIDAHHWWSVPELERTEEIYHPQDLLEVLKRLGITSC